MYPVRNKRFEQKGCFLFLLTLNTGTIIGVQKHAIIRDRDIYLQLQAEAQAKGTHLLLW